MARLTILLALLAVALFAAVQASAWPPQQSGCESKLQRVNLRVCGHYLTAKIWQEYRGKEEEEEEEDEDVDGAGEVLRMRATGGMRRNLHHHDNKQIGLEDFKEWCCWQLSRLADQPKCLCEGMQQIMNNEKEQMKRLVVILEGQLWYLPLSCGLRTPFGCDLRGQN